MRTALTGLLSLLLAAPALSRLPTASGTIAFTNATITDVRSSRLIPGMTVVVVGNRIAALGETGTVRLPAGASVIDASGKYLIPGLWDMHAHLGAVARGR